MKKQLARSMLHNRIGLQAQLPDYPFTHFRLLCLFLLMSFLGVQLAACATPPTPTESIAPTAPVQPTEPPSANLVKVIQSQVQRDQAPQAAPADLGELVQGNNAFAIDLYRQVRHQNGNQFFSPLSLSLALAMTFAGARGETEAQMAQTLRFTLPQDRLHLAFNDLDLQLTAQQEPGKDEPQPFLLSIANSLWGEQTFTFLPEFLDILALNYGAGLRLVDFIGAPDAARMEINEWVYQETHEKIEDLIPKGGITSDTRLVLANAIYFKADWVQQFSANRTQEMPFNTLDGKQALIPMMRMEQPAHLGYIAGDGFQAVELPYVGERVSMLVVVPDDGTFTGFEASLTPEQVISILKSLEPRSVVLTFPKFTFETSFSVADMLKKMGMTDAFDRGLADFSGMDGNGELYISDVFHKAFVAVDEKGTEAAAASAVVVGVTSAIMPDVQLVVDRPFIFLILDRQSGSILFVGRVLDPSLK